MIPLVLFCFVVNVAITATLPFLMLQSGAGVDVPYGIDTPARRILACLYASIAAVSSFAILSYAVTRSESQLVQIALVLFPLQIFYKLATVYAVGLGNPVVRANVAIVALLIAALFTIWTSGRLSGQT